MPSDTKASRQQKRDVVNVLKGMMALAAGIFFATRRQTWKNFGFIMLSGFLITTALAGIRAYDAGQ
ncbi:MAG: hypothetical protein ABIU06_06545, partial [Anaerolineales bacterium]